MKDKVLTNFGKKKESSGQSLKLQNVFQKMQRDPVEKQIEVIEEVIPKPDKKSKVKEKSFNFSFVSEAENINYIRRLEFEKRRQGSEFSYFTSSDVVKEGISLLRKRGPKLKNRPAGMIPTRRGRVSNGTELKEKVTTSFSLIENEVDYIYDYIYTKSGDVLGSFTKEAFMNDMIKALKNKYGELE